MKKIIALIICATTLSACTMPFTKQSKSALDIKSDLTATVYLNGNHVGATPFYKDDLKPGEYTVKLVVENDQQLEWQTQVNLKPQLLTNITRFFGASEDVSSHFTLSLEDGGTKDSGEITVITLPDSAVVKRNGQPVGFAPVEMKSLTPDDYQITISSPGYKQLVVPIKAVVAHKLIISAKLAKDKDMTVSQPSPTPEASSAATTALSSLTPSTSPSPTPSVSSKITPSSSSANIKVPYVTILDTPTGWLRVRSEPSGVTDNEVGRVNVGQKFSLTKNNNAGWYQIEYSPGQYGWISAQYAKITQ